MVSHAASRRTIGVSAADWLMTLALRWMGNLVDEADRDRAARVWRWAGRRSMARDARPPFS